MSERLNVLVTGASGFIGRNLRRQLLRRDFISVTPAVRRLPAVGSSGFVEVGEMSATTDWSPALKAQQVVIHTAGRAHIMRDEVADPLAEYRRVNVYGTLNLARQAAESGVKRFIFISSIKVNGEQTQPGMLFTAADPPAPEDAYGISKLEAEQRLQDLSRQVGMELVVIRPTLVYGPGAKGNFASLLRWVELGLPLPLGAVHNRRSLVGLWNLIDLIIICIDHPAAANQVFLAGDAEDLSLSDLLRRVAAAMGKPSRLLPVPPELLQLGATLLGQKAVGQRLLGSLCVDISKTREQLGWEPPYTLDQGLRHCFLEEIAPP